MIHLSILDQSPISVGGTAAEALAGTSRLVKEAERLGYRRFWVSEHHFAQALAGSSPEVLISHLAGQTTSIRVGSGGVMLPHYSPYKVAENFKVLEGLYPDRIDIGLGRAPGGMPLATRALQEDKMIDGVDHYPEQLDDLIGYLHDATGEEHRFAGLLATPVLATAPEMWLLGSSGDSAVIAARRGAGFAFAQFINGSGGIAAVEAYKRMFEPSILGDEPRVIVAIFVVCAETEERANEVASSLDLSLLLLDKGERGKWRGTPSIAQAKEYPYGPYDQIRIAENRKRMIVGDPKQVKEQLLEMSERYGSSELMLVTTAHDFEDKLKSYRLIASEFELNKDE